MVDAGMYHEFECEIEDQETNGIIKPQEHWNAPHKPVKLLGYELVDELDVENETSITFPDLDGDEDGEYLIEIETDNTYISGNSSFYLYLNNDVGSNYKMTIHTISSAGGHAVSTSSSCNIAAFYYSSNSITSGSITIKAKSGRYRSIDSNLFTVGSAGNVRISNQGAWLNSVDNLTSLVIAVNNINISGTLRLWKKLPLNIE